MPAVSGVLLIGSTTCAACVVFVANRSATTRNSAASRPARSSAGNPSAPSGSSPSTTATLICCPASSCATSDPVVSRSRSDTLQAFSRSAHRCWVGHGPVAGVPRGVRAHVELPGGVRLLVERQHAAAERRAGRREPAHVARVRRAAVVAVEHHDLALAAREDCGRLGNPGRINPRRLRDFWRWRQAGNPGHELKLRLLARRASRPRRRLPARP